MAPKTSAAPLGKKNLFNTPGVQLPPYVRQLVRGIKKKKPEWKLSRLISTAINMIKKIVSGVRKSKPDTKRLAAQALKQWYAARAKARATPNKR